MIASILTFGLAFGLITDVLQALVLATLYSYSAHTFCKFMPYFILYLESGMIGCLIGGLFYGIVYTILSEKDQCMAYTIPETALSNRLVSEEGEQLAPVTIYQKPQYFLSTFFSITSISIKDWIVFVDRKPQAGMARYGTVQISIHPGFHELCVALDQYPFYWKKAYRFNTLQMDFQENQQVTLQLRFSWKILMWIGLPAFCLIIFAALQSFWLYPLISIIGYNSLFHGSPLFLFNKWRLLQFAFFVGFYALRLVFNRPDLFLELEAVQ